MKEPLCAMFVTLDSVTKFAMTHPSEVTT